MKFNNKICLSNSLILLFIIIIIGIYFYKGYKEGFTPPSNLQNRFGNNTTQTPLLVPPVSQCSMLTSYGKDNCNNNMTTNKQKCIWNSNQTDMYGRPIHNSVGGACETIF